MIGALPWTAWVRLLLAAAVFCGPGALLTGLWAGRRRLEPVAWLALTLALASAFWPLSLLWVGAAGGRLGPVSVSVLGAAALAAAVLLVWRRGPAWTAFTRWDVLTGLAALAAAGLSVWSLREAVAGLGSDSYQHTLIVQLILDRGRVPTDYAPYAPLTSFTYHFGSHAGTAVFAWLAGLPARLALPLAGEFFKLAAVLGVAALAQWTTGRRTAAAAAAVVAGLICVFPAFYINWGRYPQLAGLGLMPVIMGALWEWLERGADWRTVWLFGGLGAGLTLIHYRVVLMTAGGAAVVLAAWWFSARPGWARLRAVATRLSVAGLVAVIGLAPWLWQARSGPGGGYPVTLSPVLPSAFSLNRLGDLVIGYPTNGLLLAFIVAALGWGLWRRQRVVWVMLLWAAGLWAASGPALAGGYMDSVTVFISLYVPAGVVVGWAAAERGSAPQRWPRWAAAGALTLTAGLGAWSLAQIAYLPEGYVGAADLPAADWIAAHTPADAKFLVNQFVFDFRPDYVVGSDAGTWLPLLAGRPVVALPMTYPIERVAAADYPARLVRLLQVSANLADPAAVALLRAEGIGYVYIGQRGGPIQPEALRASPAFEEVYQSGPVAVFRLK